MTAADARRKATRLRYSMLVTAAAQGQLTDLHALFVCITDAVVMQSTRPSGRGEGFRSFPMPYPVRFVILGGGNFGLALSHVLARNSIPTTLLLRKQSIADYINEVHMMFRFRRLHQQGLCKRSRHASNSSTLLLLCCIQHHEHPTYLKGIKLPWHIRATANASDALKDATYVIHAVPVQYSRAFLHDVSNTKAEWSGLV